MGQVGVPLDPVKAIAMVTEIAVDLALLHPNPGFPLKRNAVCLASFYDEGEVKEVAVEGDQHVGVGHFQMCDKGLQQVQLIRRLPDFNFKLLVIFESENEVAHLLPYYLLIVDNEGVAIDHVGDHHDLVDLGI